MDANRFVMKNDLQGIYNVSTGISITPNQLWDALSHSYPNDLSVIYEDLRDGECINNVLSSEKLQSEGWELKIGLIEGLSLRI